MKVTKVVAFTMAVSLLLGGVAAVGGATPADGTATDAANASETSTDTTTETDDAETDDSASDEDASVGPSDGLPEQAPDHVSGIHDRIESFLNGSTENLGHSLSEFLGNEESADEAADESADDDSDA